MTDSEKKQTINLLPAILTGAAALIAALTTVYVNLRNDPQDDPAPLAAAASAAPVVAEPAPAARPQPIVLQLQRIAVHEDGAVGNADWRFAIEADGQPVFAFEQNDMTSEGGRNIFVTADNRDASAELYLLQDTPIAITIKGWRGGWFNKAKEPLVLGEGWLTTSGAVPPIKVNAANEKDGAFTFYLNALPDPE